MAIRIVGVDLPQNTRGEVEMCIRDSIMETRPLSKTKRWRLVERIERAK